MENMAKIHQMPPDTNEKEKIVGGILDSTQLICLLIGAGIGVVITLLMYPLLKGFALFLFLPPFFGSFPFAFRKVEELSYPKYLRLKYKFKHKTKYYINEGGRKDLTFDVEDTYAD